MSQSNKANNFIRAVQYASEKLSQKDDSFRRVSGEDSRKYVEIGKVEWESYDDVKTSLALTASELREALKNKKKS